MYLSLTSYVQNTVAIIMLKSDHIAMFKIIQLHVHSYIRAFSQILSTKHPY